MLNRLFGSETTTAQLKTGMTDSTRAVRQIAHRVSNASTGEEGDFASALENASGVVDGRGVDLEQEMVALAEEQLRYEATARLLQKVYQQIRTSVRGQ